jgi:uncharacterized membrane protein YeaQ/YmgE (transglycosylase-associated protein family)
MLAGHGSVIAGSCKGAQSQPRRRKDERSPTLRTQKIARRRVWMPSLDQFIVWIIVGLLGGSLAGLIITRERQGFGMIRNLGLGLLGALVGGLLFRLLGIFPGLGKIAISLRDVVAALIGSLLVVIAIWLWQRFKRSK